jgi:hypothetical protein
VAAVVAVLVRVELAETVDQAFSSLPLIFYQQSLLIQTQQYPVRHLQALSHKQHLAKHSPLQLREHYLNLDLPL